MCWQHLLLLFTISFTYAVSAGGGRPNGDGDGFPCRRKIDGGDCDYDDETPSPTEEPTHSCPEPLIEWSFDDRRARHLYGDGSSNVFDLNLYISGEMIDGDYDAEGGPYVSNGRLRCRRDDLTPSRRSGINNFALSSASIPFDCTGAKTFLSIARPVSCDDDSDGAIIAINRRFSEGTEVFTYDTDNAACDAISYSAARKEWYPGSEGNVRSDSYEPGFEETCDDSDGDRSVVLIQVYDDDGDIRMYRNCVRYGRRVNRGVGVQSFPANGGSRFMFCADAFGGRSGEFEIEYAAYFGYALDEDEIEKICQCDYDTPDPVVIAL